MLAEVSFLELLHWQTWTAPVVGLTSAGLMLLLARTFLRRRNQPLPLSPPPPSPSKERAPLQDPFDLGSTSERRSTIRRIGRTIKVLVSNADAQAEPVRGWVCDRSIGGVCL